MLSLLLKFWEADVTSTGTTFTVTSKSWFSGKSSGEVLDLGFQLGFSGSTKPKFTSIIINEKNVCGSGGEGGVPGPGLIKKIY